MACGKKYVTLTLRKDMKMFLCNIKGDFNIVVSFTVWI